MNAGKLNKKSAHDVAVNRLLEQFRPVVAAALNNGYQIGVDDTRRQLAAQIAGVELPANGHKKRDKTVKGVVACPVPGCKNPGVKPLNCFCRPHDKSLSDEKKKKLREQQLVKRAEDRKKAAASNKEALKKTA